MMSASPLHGHAAPALPRRYRALIVDDQRDFRYLITVFLQRSGLPVDVEAVSTGADALHHAGAELPDLILLDLVMPEMDGVEVCRRLRADERTRAIPILMLTALDDPADRIPAVLAGTDDCLAKPFDRPVLLDRMRRMLQRTYGYVDAAAPAAQASYPGEPA